VSFLFLNYSGAQKVADAFVAETFGTPEIDDPRVVFEEVKAPTNQEAVQIPESLKTATQMKGDRTVESQPYR
jgi:hypothetical protein